MDIKMILSASGWRKVFAESGNEQDRTALIGDDNTAIAILAASAFSDYVKEKTEKENPVIILGMDARPTGSSIAEAAIKAFLAKNITPRFTGIVSAPEIMAYSRNDDAFMYISASHNPIGHNGMKFGLSSGGVLSGAENSVLMEKFALLYKEDDCKEKAFKLIFNTDEKKLSSIYELAPAIKKEAEDSYRDFLKWTITGSGDPYEQEKIFSLLRKSVLKKRIGVVCDMNGSARAAGLDASFFAENGIEFYAINDKPGDIAHEIIPENENLIYVAEEMARLQKEGRTDAIIGYMPDCDGDRGNIVYWNRDSKKAVILKAQEVFSISVLSELTYSNRREEKNNAVCVNCPTSMRIEEIANHLKAKVFRAEVGEANVVNLASEKRMEGYNVRIFGEGSNGGNITYPSAVRDPLNTIFAIIKLLSIEELFKNWCLCTGSIFTEDFTLEDIVQSIPKYTTTGVSEPRAILHIATKDHSLLKKRFQNVFLNEWNEKKDLLFEKYGILFWEAVATNGTKETRKVNDFSISGKGGLKIVFYDSSDNPIAIIWMRGSGTEPVFRIMCDVKGENPDMEKALLEWETQMLLSADK